MNIYPILILHGWNLDSKKFSPLVKEFNRKGLVAEAIDLPGFGKSNIPRRSLILSDYVKFVERHIKKKKWTEVVIIGHSFGGRILTKLASKNPDYLKAVILSGTPGFSPVSKFWTIFFLTL